MSKVEQQWVKYRDSCYGGPLRSEQQERECRQAFVGGMFVALGMQDEMARMADQTEGVRLLNELHEEVIGELMMYGQAATKGMAS